jgi:DNA-binding Xre family transcriptional regulator
MAAAARMENERLAERLAAAEAELNRLKGGPAAG